MCIHAIAVAKVAHNFVIESIVGEQNLVLAAQKDVQRRQVVLTDAPVQTIPAVARAMVPAHAKVVDACGIGAELHFDFATTVWSCHRPVDTSVEVARVLQYMSIKLVVGSAQKRSGTFV